MNQDAFHRRFPRINQPAALRLLNMHPEEGAIILRSAGAFFCLLASYYILRPVRETMGLTGGVSDLRWLFLATMACMLVANPLFGVVVGRVKRAMLVPVIYGFFALNLALFYIAFLLSLGTVGVGGAGGSGGTDIWVARAFFVWVSVYNLFVVSVYWSLMDDIFRLSASKRVFGLIAAGGSAGGIIGAGTTALLVAKVNEFHLLPISIVLLALAGWLLVGSLHDRSNQLTRTTHAYENPPYRTTDSDGVEGVAWSGIPRLVRSPYMLGVCGYILIGAITATILYFEQAELVDSGLANRTDQTAFFARIDFFTNVVAFVLQAFVAGWLMSRIGVGFTLAILPVITGLAFIAFNFEPSLMMIAIVQIARRSANFAFARPARETLFTVLPRQDRYKAKNLIDTFVYRSGDALGVLAKIALIALPISLLWIALAFGLGAWQTRRAAMNAQARTPAVTR